MSKKSLKVWYSKGLKFKCTGCGQCCTGAPGYVWLTKDDIERLSKHLNISEEEFLKKHTRFVQNRYSLLESKENYDCIFLKENRCTVYEARPVQCRKFPWWKENLSSEKAWEEASLFCE